MEITKGIVYYTDNRIDDRLAQKVRGYLTLIGLPIISVSLQPIDFGQNIVLPLERSILTMFKQILVGLEAIDTDIVFFVEHDILYSKEHFEFTPLNKETYFYNQSSWMIRESDGYAVQWLCQKVSQLCAYRDFLLKHYKERVKRVEMTGYSQRIGFEPGGGRSGYQIDKGKYDWFETTIPNLDIRHKYNLTSSRWNQNEFTNKRKCRGWKTSHLSKLPGWEGLIL